MQLQSASSARRNTETQIVSGNELRVDSTKQFYLRKMHCWKKVFAKHECKSESAYLTENVQVSLNATNWKNL